MSQSTGRDSVQLSFGCKSFVHTVEIVQTTSSDAVKFKLQLVCAVPHFVPKAKMWGRSEESTRECAKDTLENVSVACEPVNLVDVLTEHIQCIPVEVLRYTATFLSDQFLYRALAFTPENPLHAADVNTTMRVCAEKPRFVSDKRITSTRATWLETREYRPDSFCDMWVSSNLTGWRVHEGSLMMTYNNGKAYVQRVFGMVPTSKPWIREHGCVFPDIRVPREIYACAAARFEKHGYNDVVFFAKGDYAVVFAPAALRVDVFVSECRMKHDTVYGGHIVLERGVLEQLRKAMLGMGMGDVIVVVA